MTGSNEGQTMTRVLYVGQDPKTVDFSDPALPPGTTADKIQSGIELAANRINSRGWQADLCMITPDDAGIATLRDQLGTATYDCVVIGGGVRLPAKAHGLFEKVLNTIHHGAPLASIALNTRPDDTADAVARWIRDE